MKVSTHVADVLDQAAVSKAAKEIGQWDVLICNAYGSCLTVGLPNCTDSALDVVAT